jgi:MFS transporter, PPP family, 3-phenylpropionic acid transporter
MRDTRVQFFLTFCMLGTVGPFASVFFRERGLSERQLGYAFAIQNLVGVLSPAVMTLVADAKVDARRVLMLMSAIVAVGLVGMTSASGTAQVLAVWTLYCVAQTAIFPLQDGLHFSQQRRTAQTGGRMLPYHKARVWGAIGYMTPGVLLYYPLKSGSGLGVALAMGAAFAVLAAIQALLLHDVRPANPSAGGANSTSEAATTRMPTLAALRMLLEPRMLVFCAAIILVYMAFSIHWTYYAVYLTEQVKLGNQWIGVANNVAMCIEIPVTFLCGWFLLRFGVKRVVALGMSLMALRLALIASTNSPWVAVGTQVFHAFLILAVSIVPHTILDNRAGDRFRHSMQALFVVMVSCGNAFANLLAGWLAEYGLHVLFALGACLCVIAAVLIWTLWTDEPAPATATVEPMVPPVELSPATTASDR